MSNLNPEDERFSGFSWRACWLIGFTCAAASRGIRDVTPLATAPRWQRGRRSGRPSSGRPAGSRTGEPPELPSHTGAASVVAGGSRRRAGPAATSYAPPWQRCRLSEDTPAEARLRGRCPGLPGNRQAPCRASRRIFCRARTCPRLLRLVLTVVLALLPDHLLCRRDGVLFLTSIVIVAN